MTTFEEAISDEEVEDVEKAKRDAKRSKTKYGDLLPDEDTQSEGNDE
jgi:hypothetical protein